MTKRKKAPQNLWYDDACGAAHALELVGERWALLVVRELLFGPRRFGELRGGLPGISANVLTQRLAGLEAAGIVVRRQLPSPANAQVYELTPWGHESQPMLEAMARWAARSPSHDRSLPLSAASLVLSFRMMLDRKRAKGVEATVGLHLGHDTFVARVHEEQLTAQRAALEDVDATLVAEPTALASVVYGGQSLSLAEARGVVTVKGDRNVARRFVTLFRLPPKVG